jgi:hypothetical protein
VDETRFERRRRSLLMAAGILSPLFAPYRAAIGATWFGGSLPAPATRFIAFIYGPIGATSLGTFSCWPGRRGAAAPWAVTATWTSVGAWFVIDAGLSLWHGAAFNLWMVDGPTVLVLAPALLFSARRGAMAVEKPFPMQIRYELEDAPGGTLTRIRTHGEATGFFRVAAPLLGGMVRRSIKNDLGSVPG